MNITEKTRHLAAPDEHCDPAIKTEALAKRFGALTALAGIDLVVPRGSIFGFLGPNGAGKTTAIKLLLGLSRPTSGRAAVFGLDSQSDSLAVRSRVGYLAQDPRYYPHMTAREVLRFTARFFDLGPGRAVEARINETLELVGLTEKADRPIKGFSGGERQRLGIAQAQVNHPDLLILDEPAAALDPLGRRDVLEVMTRLREHTTIFYSTHILDDVQRVSDHVAILDRGRMVACAPTAELLEGGDLQYELIVRGNAATLLQTLGSTRWITNVVADCAGGHTTLTVDTDDQDAAETQLLQLAVADADTVVLRYGRREHNLEDVFLRLVEG